MHRKQSFRAYYRRLFRFVSEAEAKWARDNLLVAFLVAAVIAMTVYLVYRGSPDLITLVASMWVFGLAILVFVLVSLIRAPWQLDCQRQQTIDDLTEELNEEKTKNQKPEIHINVLEGLLLFPGVYDASLGSQRMGSVSKELALYLKLENHRPVKTTIQDVFLDLTIEGKNYCDNSVNGCDELYAYTKSGVSKQLFGLGVVEMEPLEYANHDDGWIIFTLPGIPQASSIEAEMQITVVDGLGNSHRSGQQKLLVHPAIG